MEKNNEIFISPNYQKDDYNSLQLKSDSNDDLWQTAINIFTDRIKGRYFAQINLLSNDINSNGFAIMALNCLLVETMFQFKEGLNETPARSNKQMYINFLQDAFGNIFDSENKATRFYTDIRCGILHSAQTKKRSRLTCNNSYVIEYNNGVFSVSVEKFSKLLRDYFDDYTEKLLEPTNTDLRNNFIQKMSYICK